MSKPRLFLSYARADNADGFVDTLHAALTEAGFEVWWDRVSMPSRGTSFVQAIADAIDGCDRLLLVHGSHAARSDHVRAEWQYALMAGKVVTTLLREGRADELPSELRPLHAERAGRERRLAETVRAVLRLAADAPAASPGSMSVPPASCSPPCRRWRDGSAWTCATSATPQARPIRCARPWRTGRC